MYSKAYKLKSDEYRFLAAIQGQELPDSEEERIKAKIEEAEAKAYAQITGTSEEQYTLEDMFEFIDEDEGEIA